MEENREKIKDRIIKDIWNLFDTKEEKGERKRLEKLERKKQEHNERLISIRIIRDIRTLFEQEDQDYLKPKRINSFWNNNYIEYESSGDKSLSTEYWKLKTMHLISRIAWNTKGMYKFCKPTSKLCNLCLT